MSVHGDCHDVGLNGGCGYDCHVFVSGDCEHQDEMNEARAKEGSRGEREEQTPVSTLTADEIVAAQPMTGTVDGLEVVWITAEDGATSTLEKCNGDWAKAVEARKTVRDGGEVAQLWWRGP